MLATIDIAGHEYQQYFDPSASLHDLVTWDGTDGFNRPLQGPQTADVSITYFYNGALQIGEGFGVPGVAPTDANTNVDVPNATLTTTYTKPIGVWDAKGHGLGGFSLDVLHAYDPVHQTVFFGWGDTRSARNVALMASEPTRATSSNGQGPKGFDLGTPDNVLVAPDGSVFLTDDEQFDETAPGRILHIDTDGTTHVIAGPGADGAAAAIHLGSPQGIAFESDGTLLVSDYLGNAVRAIHPDGSMTTLVSESADDAPVVQASLESLDGIVLGHREELYIVNGDQVLRLEAGVLEPFAGIDPTNGPAAPDQSGDGGPAPSASLVVPSAVAMASDGSVYISEVGKDGVAGGHRVRRVTPDGIIHTVAGTGKEGYSGDGHAATDAALSKPHGLAITPDGTPYIADQGNQRIRRVTPDGVIQTVFGGGHAKDGIAALAANAQLDSPDGLALGQDGALYVAAQRTLYRVAPGFGGPARSASTETIIPSSDGKTLYRFDDRGRHEATVDAVAGVTLLTFVYDDAGRIQRVTDVNGQATVIERSSDGTPSAIVSPFGQRTSLALDDSGNIHTVTDSLSRTATLEYDSGLLTTLTDPKRAVYSYQYNPSGTPPERHRPDWLQRDALNQRNAGGPRGDRHHPAAARDGLRRSAGGRRSDAKHTSPRPEHRPMGRRARFAYRHRG